MQSVFSEARKEILINGLLNENDEWMVCDWQALCAQLLQQWNRLAPYQLEQIGPSRRHIAALVEREYDVDQVLVENYLRNLERTLPLAQLA